MPSCPPDIADHRRHVSLRNEVTRRDLFDRIAGGIGNRQCRINLNRVEAREVQLHPEVDQFGELGAQLIVIPRCLLRHTIERETESADFSQGAVGSYHDLDLCVAQVVQLLPYGVAVDNDVVVVDDDRPHLAKTLQ